jgi:hypothetical protein
MRYGATSHNRSVYAAGAVAPLAFVRLGHSATFHSHGSLWYILPAPVAFLRNDASRCPYSGWQNVMPKRSLKVGILMGGPGASVPKPPRRGRCGGKVGRFRGNIKVGMFANEVGARSGMT